MAKKIKMLSEKDFRKLGEILADKNAPQTHTQTKSAFARTDWRERAWTNNNPQ